MRLIVLLALALPSCAAHGLPAGRPTPPGLAAPIPATPAPTTPPSPLIPSPVPLIPPEEYDHPYKGRLVIQRFSDQKVLRAQCSYSPFPFLLGCAREAMGVCYIAMADDELLNRLNYPYEVVLRHETAHCNGWPAHHPGAP